MEDEEGEVAVVVEKEEDDPVVVVVHDLVAVVAVVVPVAHRSAIEKRKTFQPYKYMDTSSSY